MVSDFNSMIIVDYITYNLSMVKLHLDINKRACSRIMVIYSNAACFFSPRRNLGTLLGLPREIGGRTVAMLGETPLKERQRILWNDCRVRKDDRRPVKRLKGNKE